MDIYLVGGAVRDQLLDLPVIDKDWVVVGASVQQMRDANFKEVGKDFPVFLHPDTKEEYALARTERKTAPGYTGFEFDTSQHVTLEQDLMRRDLTINAIAQDSQGKLIDPFNGVQDIKNKKLRHVSDAFSEDPVRVLRVARFMSRFSALGFSVADETLELMQQMVSNGEVSHLVPERVWQEMERALKMAAPGAFIETLRACGALAILLPEVDALFGVPQPPQWHPEIDSGIHTLMVLNEACKLSDNAEVRFAALVHDIGKALTPKNEWPAHKMHEKRGADIMDALCDRLRAPKRFRDLAKITAELHLKCHRAFELKASTLQKFLTRLDVIRKPERFEQFLLACTADARGRQGAEDNPYPQADYLRKAVVAFNNVDASAIAKAVTRPSDIADEIRLAQLKELKQFIKLENERSTP